MYGLSSIELQQIRQVFASQPEVKEVWLYGSRARGDYKPYSDIDISLVGNLTTSHLAELETQLDDLLLPYAIDLICLQSVRNAALKANIAREGVKL